MRITLWTFGLIGGLFFKLLVLCRRIEIVGYEKEKLDPKKDGLILLVNHPSLWDPAILLFLFFPRFLFSSRFAPFSMPDKKNFYDKWWFFPFRFLCYAIDRGNPREELRTINEVLRPAALAKRILILHAETGRTFKAKRKRGSRISPYGNEIALFPKGIRKLFLDIPVRVVPIWVEGGDRVISNKYELQKAALTNPRFWRKICRKIGRIISILPRFWRKVKIIIGEPLEIKGLSRDEIINYLEDSLLAIADQYIEKSN